MEINKQSTLPNGRVFCVVRAKRPGPRERSAERHKNKKLLNFVGATIGRPGLPPGGSCRRSRLRESARKINIHLILNRRRLLPSFCLAAKIHLPLGGRHGALGSAAPYDIAIFLHRPLLYLLSTIVAKPHISLGPRPLALGPIREGASEGVAARDRGINQKPCVKIPR